MLSKKETLAKEPLVKKEGLKGGGYYVEYRTDDARLTIEVMKRAAEKGAEIINYTKSEHFTYDKNQQVNGVNVIDKLTNENYTIKAKKWLMQQVHGLMMLEVVIMHAIIKITFN